MSEVKCETSMVVRSVLKKNGILISDSPDDINLREQIQDSIQYISFIVTLEQELNIEIPDEMLSIEALDSFNGFCKRLDEILE